MNTDYFNSLCEARRNLYEWANTARVGNEQAVAEVLRALDTAIKAEARKGPPAPPA